MTDRTPWPELLQTLERELESTADEPRAGGLCCRLALLHWDVLGDLSSAERWLLRADQYLPAVVLHRQLLLARGDGGRAAALIEVLAGHTESQQTAAELLLDAALLRLLWCRDPRAAASVCGQALRLGPADPQLLEVAGLAFAAAADYVELVDLARAPAATVSAMAVAAVALADQLQRPDQAIELLVQALELDDGDPFILELLLELGALGRDDERRAALLNKKLELLDKHDRSGPENLAVALDLARLLGGLGRVAEAGGLLDRLAVRARDPDMTDPLLVHPLDWSETFLLGARREQAVRTRDLAALARIYLELAQASRLAALARVHRLRAAQLLDHLGDPDAESLLQGNVEENPADCHSARTLEQHRLRAGHLAELAPQLEAQARACPELKGQLLRRAAIVAEAHLKDLTLAASLRRDGLAVLADPFGHADLQRLYRLARSDARLMEAYQREADSSSDAEQTALLYSGVASLRLKLQQLGEATAAAHDALRARPDDPLALALLGWLHREGGREQELVRVLHLQAESMVAPENRAAIYRQLAAMTAEAHEAKGYLAQALQLRAGDVTLLAELAQSCERAESYEEALSCWRKLAAALDGQPAAACDAYLRAGRIYAHHLSDRARAVEAFNAALRLDPGSLTVMRELAQLHRLQGDQAELLATLRRLAPLDPDRETRARLLLEVATLVEQTGGASAELLEAYAAAARADGGRPETVAELERICRREGRADLLAAVLAELPPTASNLELHARTLRQLGDHETLCGVQEQLVELSRGPLERADRAFELGQTFETLARLEDAVAAYQDVVGEMPGHRPALQALQRVHRAEGRNAALARALEQELEVASEAERRAELLLELARALEELKQPERAAARYEDLLRVRPDQPDALLALEKLYDPSRPLELARVLRLRAEAATTAAERASLNLRAGNLLVSQGDDEKAAEALWQAFVNDPSNRAAFTFYESFCYERERWHALTELYDEAIRYVEEEAGRAYRPIDLYVRRGQLQLKHLGQPGEAAESYLKALEHDPKSESTMKVLEAIFVQQQDWIGLVRAYEHRAGLVANELFRLESLRQAARIMVSRLPHQPDEAMRLWEAIYRADPIDEEALDNLERLYQQEEQFDRLVDLLDTRLALMPQDEETIPLRLRVATLCETELENPERAARTYEGIRQIQEHHEESLKALSRIYEATGEWEHCLDVLKDLVIMEADPDERSLLYFKCGSIVESRFNDDEAASGYYEAALGESQGCLPAIHGLRDLYLRREEWNKVLDTLQIEAQLWEEKREQAGILARMGEIRLHHLKDTRKALEHFEAALAIDPECQGAALALFNAYFDRGDNARALPLCANLAVRLAREGDPEERSRFYNRRGQLLVAVGQLQAAAESLVIALEIRPKNLEALDWLIALCRRSPDAYDFATVFRELEQVYRREDDPEAVGHVLVAAAALSEIVGDAETALARYGEAIEAAPTDFTPVKSLSDLLIRLRRTDEAMAALRNFAERATEKEAKLKALLRLGDIWANVVLDSAKAITLYQEALALDSQSREASDHLAQEYYVVGRLDDAHRTIQGVIEQARDGTVRPQRLARHEHYLGVILLKKGDAVRAEEQFRRALQLDPSNALAAMALARQLALAGDRDGAERLLSSSVDALAARATSDGLLDLQRSLAGLHLGAGNVDAALACYQAVVRDGQHPEDQVALAEALAQQPDGVPRALGELARVLERDSFNLHALRLLAELHERSGENERVANVLQVIEVLGWSAPEDQGKLAQLRRPFGSKVSGGLDDQTHGELSAMVTDPHVQRLWSAVRERLEKLFPLEMASGSPVPADQVGKPQLRQLVDWCVRLFRADAKVLVADEVAGGVIAADGRIVIDRLFIDRPAADVAFALARTLEYLRSGHALLSRLAFDDRQLLGELLGGLLRPETSNDLVEEFRRGLPRRTLKELDGVVELYQQHLAAQGAPEQPARWLTNVDRLANNAGLLTCDDLTAALRVLALLSGQETALGPHGEVAVWLIPEGPELVKFFLSDTYLVLQRRLAAA